MTHTKGQWKYEVQDEDGWYTVWTDYKGTGASIAENIGEEANAQLIASAPELLEACKLLLEAVEEARIDSDSWEYEYKKLQEVISKAEGK